MLLNRFVLFEDKLFVTLTRFISLQHRSAIACFHMALSDSEKSTTYWSVTDSLLVSPEASVACHPGHKLHGGPAQAQPKHGIVMNCDEQHHNGVGQAQPIQPSFFKYQRLWFLRPSFSPPVTSISSLVYLKNVEVGCHAPHVCNICSRQIFRRQKTRNIWHCLFHKISYLDCVSFCLSYQDGLNDIGKKIVNLAVYPAHLIF